jgi:phospholipid-binding lipoprotein MlaA
VRDAIVIPIDIQADPWAYKNPARWRNVGIALRAVDQRASVLDASNLMEEAALDRYEFIRDGFLQRRQSRITDNGEQKVKQLNIKIPFRKDGAPDAKPGEPTDAKGIRAAYPDDPGATATAAGAAKGAPAKGADAKGAEAKPAKPADAPAEAKPAADAPSDAKAIRAAYEDDPGPTPEAPAEQKPRKGPAVSSKPAAK